MKTPEKSRKPRWFPGRATTRDAHGDMVGPSIGGHEYAPRAEARYSATNTMRWSLGIT